jgi:hypothetical protein
MQRGRAALVARAGRFEWRASRARLKGIYETEHESSFRVSIHTRTNARTHAHKHPHSRAYSVTDVVSADCGRASQGAPAAAQQKQRQPRRQRVMLR